LNFPGNSLSHIRDLADQAFSRAAGAPLIEGNYVRLLKDARENYPAWLDAISAAKHHIHLESYIIYEDDTGRRFADALAAKAREGVRVRLIYDWVGGLGKASRQFWDKLRQENVEVRCYNPPRLDSPLGWLSRDHRKMLSVDNEVGFISGLCIGRMWEGIPEKKLEPWRDTGIEVRGPAVADIEQAFAQVWAVMGERIPRRELVSRDAHEKVGKTELRIVANSPAEASTFRLDHLVSALARERLWLTDAYFAGTAAYVQALMAAAKDGVDVRLLVPGGSDLPILKAIARAGYRPLLDAGVRIFEWNGTMLHAKTAVADGHWARVGSTNLNISSWLGNYELDTVIEDKDFAHEMEEMYSQDLSNATEVILDRRKLRLRSERPRNRPVMTSGGGSVGRAAAGAVRIGHAVGAAFFNRRLLEPVEASLLGGAGILFLILASFLAFTPRVLMYPLSIMFVWFGGALLFRSYKLYREGRRKKRKAQTK